MTQPPVTLRPEEWRIVRDILRRHVPRLEVRAFGSRAGGRVKPYSDLDLVVMTEQPLDFDSIAALADDFCESDLPWKVDIVDWATTAESFRRIIEATSVVVQRAGEEANAARTAELPWRPDVSAQPVGRREET